MQTSFEITRTALTLLFLIYASWSDYRTREVSNIVWKLFAPIAFTLTALETYLFNPPQLPIYALCFGLTTVFAFVLFYSGGFGGADAKALMCLALVLPFYPENILQPLSRRISPISRIFFPITVFSNSVLLAAATAIYMLLRNIIWRQKTGDRLFQEGYSNASFGKKLLVLVTGHKASIDKLRKKWHFYPLEDVEETEEGFKRKLVLLPKDETRDEIVARLGRAVEVRKIQKNVWVTPGLPMLIFITVGLIIGLVFGDVIWICVSHLLG